MPATSSSAHNALISRTERFFASLHLSAYQCLYRGFLKRAAESWIQAGTIVLHTDNVFCISVNHDRGRVRHNNTLPALLVRHNLMLSFRQSRSSPVGPAGVDLFHKMYQLHPEHPYRLLAWCPVIKVRFVPNADIAVNGLALNC